MKDECAASSGRACFSVCSAVPLVCRVRAHGVIRTVARARGGGRSTPGHHCHKAVPVAAKSQGD